MAIKLLDENKSIKEASSKEEFLTYLNDDEGLTDMTHDELRDFYLGNNPNAKSNVKELADDFGISYETACEWIKEYFSESVVKEATGSNYVVKRLVLDVAARDEEHARKLNDGLGAPGQFGGSVFHELMKALEKCGYEMAGDQISVEDDLTDVYKDNDYEFFSESCKKVTESESDEYKSYRDKWNKNYKGKNRSRKEVDDFITSAWNDLNSGENRFTGDEFKKLCKDAGVDASKFMKESSEYPSFDKYMNNAKKMGNKSYDKFLKLVTRDNYTKVIDWTRKKGFKWDDVSYYVDNHPEVFDGMLTESEDDDFSVAFIKDNGEEVLRFFSNFDDAMDLVNNLTSDEKLVYNDCGPQFKERYRKLESVIKESFKEGNEFYVGWSKTNIDDFYKYLSSSKGLGIYKHDDGQYYMGASKDDSYSHAIENDGMKLIKSDERFKDKIFEDDHYDLANPKDAEDIDLKLTASLSVRTYEAVEALQRPRFRMKLRELVGGFGADLHECSVDETGDSSMLESRSVDDDFKEIKSKYDAVTRLGTTVIYGDKYDEISQDLLSKGYTKGSRKSWSTGTSTEYVSDNGKITVGLDNVPDYDRNGIVLGSNQQTIISMSKTNPLEN